MDNSRSTDFRKWLKKRLEKEFASNVEESLNREEDTAEIVYKIIHSEEMASLLNSIKSDIHWQSDISRSGNLFTSESRPQSSFSFASDITNDEWNSPRNNDDDYGNIIDKISRDKPVHVRLAGYETLLKTELSSLSNNPTWDLLQKALIDGLTDESRPVFEASIQIHSKLLNTPECLDVYKNLMTAFNAQYHSQKTFEILPTLISGINFKFFIHERLFRIMYLIIQYQGEVLKTVRNIDKTAEDTIEQFMTFMSTHEFGNSMHPKTLNILQIVSVLEPRADWARRWICSLGPRRTFLAALAKSPSLLQRIVETVQKAQGETRDSITFCLYDESAEVYINGNTVETVTYLHCLCFITELCSYAAGRALLSQTTFESPFDVSEFVIALVKSLNIQSSESSSTVYNVSLYALQMLLETPRVFHQDDIYHSALCSLKNKFNSDIKISAHILDIMSSMLDFSEGVMFLISECKEHSENLENGMSMCPANILILSTSDMLRQPFSIMSTEYLLAILKVVEKLLDTYDAYEVIQKNVERDFLPAVKHFYSRLDKCLFENESKAQQINSALNKLLIKFASVAFGIQGLAHEQKVFEELIRTSTTPLRTDWTSAELVNFVMTAALFKLGYNTLADLAPHILSTLLSETCNTIKDPEIFSDPSDSKPVVKLLHVLKVFSLNFNCFAAFMATSVNDSDEDTPMNLAELFCQSVNPDSEYHYLALQSLDTVIWNLNISIYLMEVLDFQNVLLQLENSQNNDEVETYFSQQIDTEESEELEEYNFTKFPPEADIELNNPSPEHSPETELEVMLQEEKPALLDSSWVVQLRQAYQDSRDPLKNLVMIQLIDQMQKAIPTAEWVENFEWPEESSHSAEFWFAEDIHGINTAYYYALEQGILKERQEFTNNLQDFISASYAFIQYEKPKKFESFDWFLATVFIICDCDTNKCKIFLSQLIQFPSTIFLWPSLGKILDKTNAEECATQITFIQLVETVVSNELANVKFALKDVCGIHWSEICNLLLSQFFWRTLPWSEIKRFLAICILYSPDYVVYYCVSLLYHCRSTVLKDMAMRTLWPENMDLTDYQSHNYISYMDTLATRYGNRILPKIGVKEGDSHEEESTINLRQEAQ